jgi:hypothetical protein
MMGMFSLYMPCEGIFAIKADVKAFFDVVWQTHIATPKVGFEMLRIHMRLPFIL